MWSLLAIVWMVWLIGNAWAQEATQTPQLSPPPESFTIEGLRIGMTAADAKASAPDLNLREAKSGRYRTSLRHDPFALIVLGPDGKIRTIEVTYRSRNGARRLKPSSFTFEGFLDVLLERWSKPKAIVVAVDELKEIFGTGPAVEIMRAAIWEKGNQTALLIQRPLVTFFIRPDQSSELPILTLTIGSDQTPAELAAEQAGGVEDVV